MQTAPRSPGHALHKKWPWWAWCGPQSHARAVQRSPCQKCGMAFVSIFSATLVLYLHAHQMHPPAPDHLSARTGISSGWRWPRFSISRAKASALSNNASEACRVWRYTPGESPYRAVKARVNTSCDLKPLSRAISRIRKSLLHQLPSGMGQTLVTHKLLYRKSGDGRKDLIEMRQRIPPTHPRSPPG